jgi:hypothetical protein
MGIFNFVKMTLAKVDWGNFWRERVSSKAEKLPRGRRFLGCLLSCSSKNGEKTF